MKSLNAAVVRGLIARVANKIVQILIFMAATGATYWALSATYDHVIGNLTPETKKVWMEVWNGVSMELRKEMLANELSNQAFWKSKGGEVIVPDVAAFRYAMKDVWKKFAPKVWGEGFYEKIQAVR